MKAFSCMEITEAIQHAADGGQALHLHRIIVDPAKAPACFVRAVERGEDIAHLFDLDKARLVSTARRLGVKVVFIDREDTPSQHIDLCGEPLRRAKKEAQALARQREEADALEQLADDESWCCVCGGPAEEGAEIESQPCCGRLSCGYQIQAAADFHNECGHR